MVFFFQTKTMNSSMPGKTFSGPDKLCVLLITHLMPIIPNRVQNSHLKWFLSVFQVIELSAGSSVTRWHSYVMYQFSSTCGKVSNIIEPFCQAKNGFIRAPWFE